MDATKKLQQQLSDSAERPALLSDIAERPASAGSAGDNADVQNDAAANDDVVLANLKERQRNRAIEKEVE